MGNKPSSFVLRALSILGPEEILKLAHVLNREEVSFKKASGDDVVFWKNEKKPQSKQEVSTKSEAKVLHFKKPISPPLEGPLEDSQDEEEHQLMSSDAILLQREISKETKLETQKVTAQLGYQKATEMYVVKSQSFDGKEKIRFASTKGVLVNKKQA